MSKPKLTPWFPGHIKPARKGVYATDASFSTFQYWDGAWWGLYMPTPATAFKERHTASRMQNVQWCGLAEPPK